ncbi:MAG: MoxR family ATPase [Myxococcales bacterium]|nr:MoxR family ATPase [Myxococcales bacterium]
MTTQVGQQAALAPTDAELSEIEELRSCRERIQHEISKRIIGQGTVVEILLTSLFAKGHCLFIGVPGLAKTMLISTLSEALSLRFNRIQFTPDLMPSDITGTDILEEDRATGRRVFKFLKGPIFSNILLADEINRTPPKTQAALLQAMQELQVSAGGTTYQLEPPFLVFATQNPIEQEGTYPLPEAQLDRFMFSIQVLYPSLEEEMEIVRRNTGGVAEMLEKVITPERILRMQQLVLRVPVADHVLAYAVRLVRATRPNEPSAPDFVREYVSWGAGPRASQYLILGAKAMSLLHGQVAVSTSEVSRLAPYVLSHRIVTNFHAEADRVSAGQIVERLLETVGP